MSILYCFCNSEVRASLLKWKFTDHTRSCTFFGSVRASHVTVACLLGAGRGKEGLVALEPDSGLQAESAHDEQRRQLLLRRHDVTHYHPQRQPVCRPSQVLLLHWRCRWRRPGGEAGTQRRHPATNQPAGIHARWYRDQRAPARAGQEQRVWHVCLFAQRHQKTPRLQRTGSISCSEQQSRGGRRLRVSHRDRNCFVANWHRETLRVPSYGVKCILGKQKVQSSYVFASKGLSVRLLLEPNETVDLPNETIQGSAFDVWLIL